MRNARWVILGLGLGALGLVVMRGTAKPQDPVKISPKLYTVLLENDQVRVLDYRDKTGEKEPMHSHPAMVVYVLAGTKLRFTTPDGKSEERESKAGTAIWSEPVTHSTENVGASEGHVLLIELKGQTTAKK